MLLRPVQRRDLRIARLYWAVLAALAAAPLAYSQAVAYFGNESFHLLASQLINAGKKPYLDFFYQHPPLFIYLNAAWMRIFGESWRAAHVLSALLTVGCMIVVQSYVFDRLAGAPWRRLVSASTASLIGLNFYVITFGTVALPFGLCLLLTVLSFRLTIKAVEKSGVLFSFLAGLCAGGSAASSLLTVPVLASLFVWLSICDRNGSRLGKSFVFAVGAAVPFFMVLWPALIAPRGVFFDVVEYHLFHRMGSEAGVSRWNLREVGDWFASLQGLVLTALAATGLAATIRRGDLDARRKSELYLCAWVSLVLSAYLATPRPTFSFYFVLLTPFLAVLAGMGLQIIASRDGLSKRKAWLITGLAMLYLAGLVSQAYRMRREIFRADHKAIEAIAREVNQVTPPDGWVFAFEQVYFEARRLPPPGMENAFDPFSRRDEWLAANRFATVCMMADDPRIESLHLFERYAKNKSIRAPDYNVYLFWELAATSDAGTPLR